MQYNMNRVAVIGAGVMGASIAALIAGTGTPVILLDIVPNALSPDDVAKGLTTDAPAFRNRFAAAGKERILNPKFRAIYHKDFGDLITVGNIEDDLESLGTCDWVLEVVLETLEVKRQLFQKIMPFVNPSAIISSNTSGVSIEQIAEPFDEAFKKRFLGTHFFNPPRYMKLFEVIPTAKTSPEIVAFMAAYAQKNLGKGVVYAKDTPNFIANRIGAQANIAVMQLTEKYGYDLPKADLLSGVMIGRPKSATFKTIDMVGLDILLHVAENVTKNLSSDEENAAYHVPDYVQKLASLKYYGDKTGGGFYKKQKTEKGLERLVWDRNTSAYVPLAKAQVDVSAQLKGKATLSEKLNTLVWGDTDENRFVWDVIKSNLLYSARCLPTISDSVAEIDNGMKWGFNWELGPFEIWEALGVKKVVERMKAEGDTIPEWVIAHLEKGKTAFYESADKQSTVALIKPKQESIIAENGDAVLVNMGDGVTCLTIKTKGNTVNRGVIDMINTAVETVEQGNYKGLVIGSTSKNFSAGADLGMIASLASEAKWQALDILIHDFQYANLALKYCRKPVIAATRGMALGGGAEMAIHAHRQVMNAESYMGLVELGVGLIPGGGGCKELLFREMTSLGKAPLAERITHLKRIWRNIAMAKVSSSAYDAKKMGFARSEDIINMNTDLQLEDAKREVLALSETAYSGNLKMPISVTGRTGFAAIQLELMQMVDGRFVSAYDGFLAEKVAAVLTGGDVLPNTMMSEEAILDLEREIFLSLCGEAKTQERIRHMLTKGKPLRN
ncbi:3-hydroxyacyl-CoA dehydrogenase/enoyl-CoA hydratase family protein [Fusibacter paucivorans]|uniref:3-hydroxyacyl-CoA dehydrogenase/enoyl-CoA hydratase family protein n=1 Tax=Fusibacter paucivorans TaxID=76009 RepID=A0ABS5PMR7_9FIRM|nr:3-hydroxyacyl-CoA dehydrogenase NAD-binding domain-containing protein [Fusibacter paucivorans]MBS7525347.1 3-hydroxyacyl-CoA dehydrogenase/enoyl-CoA hydratase family protein [Fusibacter paucivorans]